MLPHPRPEHGAQQGPLATPRGAVYAGLQAALGRPFGRLVRRLRAWERLPKAEFDRLNEGRLERMLGYAREHVPLYRTGPWGRASSSRAPSLDSWPVLERDVLRAHAGELRAVPQPARVVVRRTSGSTGPPLAVAFTREADTWGWAHRYRGLLWHGIPVGARALRLSHDRRPLRDLVLGQVSVPDLTHAGAIDRAAELLHRWRPALVTGPPSALFYLARHLRERGVGGQPAPFARVGGEQLFPFQRADIERAVGSRAIDSYGCTEIGALAGECPSGSLHVYAEHVRLEIFRGDAPAAPGDFGDIVATALHNPAMPLVRYRVGDRGRLSLEGCPCGLPHPVLLDLQARSDDRFPSAEGVSIHGADLVRRLGVVFSDSRFEGVREVQFAQVDSHSWQARVDASEAWQAGAEHEPLRRVLRDGLAGVVRETFGAACRVEVQWGSAMSRESGKFRYCRAAKGSGGGAEERFRASSGASGS